MKVGEKWKRRDEKMIFYKAITSFLSFSLPQLVIIDEFNDRFVIFTDERGIFGEGTRSLDLKVFIGYYEKVYQ